MFEKKKSKEDIEKERLRKRFSKKAEKHQKKANAKDKIAKKILDLDYVETKLSYERRKDEKRQALRDFKIDEESRKILSDEKTTFPCSLCGEEIGLKNIQCPKCGQIYCPFCGYILEDKNFSGKCPKCGNFATQGITPAKLIQVKIEDIPEEDRHWEKLKPCPKCGAAVQPEWENCPLCEENK